jgi:hypothetical protein
MIFMALGNSTDLNNPSTHNVQPIFAPQSAAHWFDTPFVQAYTGELIREDTHHEKNRS